MKYKVHNTFLEYHAEGETAWGDDRVLVHRATDLTQNTRWADTGYTIESLSTTKDVFLTESRRLLQHCWEKAGLSISSTTPADQYHLYASDKESHLRAVEFTKLLSVRDFPGGIAAIEERIGEICGARLIAKNPFDRESVFHFRVIRPGNPDNNPLHRDVWLPDYDDCINLYIPIAGSNEHSSLTIIPGSHHWSESRVEKTKAGAIINGVKFNVPAVTAIKGDYEIVRPDPKPGEVLVFSPYLIHGGAVNLNQDRTRISIELRLWKRD